MKYTPESVIRNDPENMAGGIYNFIDDLNTAMNVDVDFKASFKNILVCGMGGSAISGDMLADCAASIADYPIRVQRFPEIPKWVNKDTLCVVTSYSGNTRETLALYDYAKEKNFQTVVIAAGGTLMEKAEEDGVYTLKMIPGIQPRCATGYSLGLMFSLLDSLGQPAFGDLTKKIIPKLRKFRDSLASNRSVAWEIARKINGRTPIIYSSSTIGSVATRWKTQINENSKMIAFSGSVPEFNHNEVSGWSEGAVRDSCVPIFLYEEKSGKFKKRLMDASISTIRSYGVEPIVVDVRGRTVVEKVLRATLIGDYVSLYLAYINGVDPSEVASIKELKLRLGDILGSLKVKSTKTKKRI
ncbi:MAG: bifunctional phosphoglucose/phosphomannose isomerase [Candidatus Methanomethylophilaceae archaeon]|jgi:glucose/mannose-6-phosphate isomerase